MKIVLGPASEELGRRTAELSGLDYIQVNHKTFPDGENYVRLDNFPHGDHLIIVQTTSPPQDSRLMQLAFIVDAAKRNGAGKVTAVVPYLAYARQDKSFLQGENVSIETVARILGTAGLDSLFTVNIHQEEVLARFPFSSKNLSAISLLAEYFVEKSFGKAFALAPDTGAMYIAEQAREILGGECGYLEKKRDRYTGKLNVAKKTFNVKGKTVVILDDIISTGGTIVKAANILKEQGAERIFAACVHPLLIGDAENRILESGVEEIVGTDSVPNRFSKVSLAPLLSRELKALERG